MSINTLFSLYVNISKRKREKERATNPRPFDLLICLCNFYKENLVFACVLFRFGCRLLGFRIYYRRLFYVFRVRGAVSIRVVVVILLITAVNFTDFRRFVVVYNDTQHVCVGKIQRI